jgi:hypothetical protein
LTATQRSRIGFLTLVVLGALTVPGLAALTMGSAEYTASAAADSGPALLDAPPPISLVVLGLAMVATAVVRRYRKNAAMRVRLDS